MQDESSASALRFAAGTRAAMVALGFIPLLHVVASLLPVVLAAGGGGWQAAWLSPVLLFLLPPILVRSVTAIRPLPSGRVDPDSGAFLLCWFTAQCQVV